jgi:hypothetical protein
MHCGVAQVDVVWALDWSRLLRVFFIIGGLCLFSPAQELGDLFVCVFDVLSGIVGTEFDNRMDAFHPQLECCWAFLLFGFDGLRQEITVGG